MSMTLFRYSSQRSYSLSKNSLNLSSALKTKWESKNSTVQVSKSVNGFPVLSLDNGSPLVTLTALYKVGSRFETYENTGISHALRLTAGLSTKSYSTFGKIRGIQQFGTGLVVRQGREHMMYSLQVNRDDVYDVMDFLTQTVCCPIFKPWEVHDLLVPSLTVDLENITQDVLCTEALHKAAYRTGLGTSLYSPVWNLQNHNTTSLKEFVSDNFTASRFVFSTLGIEESHALQLEKFFDFGSSVKNDIKTTKYHGGEVRIDKPGPYAFVSLAIESSSYTDVTNVIVSSLLQRILGLKTPTKRSSGMGKLQRAVSSVLPKDCCHSVVGLNYVYSDSGLLGAFLAVEASHAGKALDAIVKELSQIKITPEELQGAKKKLMIDWSDSFSNQLNLAEEFGIQVLFNGKLQMNSMEELVPLIQSISTEQVMSLANKFKSKNGYSMSSVGNLCSVPYLDSFKN